MDRSSDLILYHPQWQGCGHDDAVRHGAAAIRKRLETDCNIRFQNINVDSSQDIETPSLTSISIKNLQSLVSNYSQVKQAIQAQHPKRIFTLGGDCGVSLYPVSYLNEKYSNFAVLWIDAHADLNNPSTSPSGNFHGMVLRSIVNGVDVTQEKVSKGLRSEQVLLVGTRDLDPAESDFIKERSIVTIPCVDISSSKVLDILKQRGVRNVYLHIDVDVMDPDDFPYSFYKVPGGISIARLRELVNGIRSRGDVEIVGGSLKEAVGGIEGDERVLGAVCEIFVGLCG